MSGEGCTRGREKNVETLLAGKSEVMRHLGRRRYW